MSDSPTDYLSKALRECEHSMATVFPKIVKSIECGLSGDPNLGVWAIDPSANFVLARNLRPRPGDLQSNAYDFDKGVQFYLDDHRTKVFLHVLENESQASRGETPRYSRKTLFDVTLMINDNGKFRYRIDGEGEHSLETVVRKAIDLLDFGTSGSSS